MAIKDLQARQGNVDIVVDVVDLGDIREFEKFGKTGRVASAKIKDESGEMKLSLWNEQIEQVKPGDKVHIKNGYVNEWQGEKQLTTGKFGSLEILDGGDAKAESPAVKDTSVTEDEMTEKESLDELGKETPPSAEEETTDESEESVDEEILDEQPDIEEEKVD